MRKKYIWCYIAIFCLFVCLIPDNMQAMEITPQNVNAGCSCGYEPLNVVCLRNKAIVAETSTHKNGCVIKVYKAPTAYRCPSCGYLDSYSKGYHYCFETHSSCGIGTKWHCFCDYPYIPTDQR